MAFDYSKLKGRIKELYGTQDAFADAVGKSRVTISEKLSGNTKMSTEDIFMWAKVLQIKDSEFNSYFFTVKTKKT